VSFRKHTGIADENGILFAYRISSPEGSEVMLAGAEKAIQELDSVYKPSGFTHSRGDFTPATFGISYGGGQTVN